MLQTDIGITAGFGYFSAAGGVEIFSKWGSGHFVMGFMNIVDGVKTLNNEAGKNSFF